MNQTLYNSIAKEMTQIFSVDPDNLDPQANLFELGLDSLMLIKLGQRLEALYKVSVSMSYFFTHLTTLEKIVGFIEDQGALELAGSAQQSIVESTTVLTLSSGQSNDDSCSGVHVNAALPLFAEQINSMQDLFRRQLETLSGKKMSQAPQPVYHGPAASVAGGPAVTGGIRNNVRGLKLADDELTNEQQGFVNDLVARHVKRTVHSREMMSSGRSVLADWKSTLSFRKTLKDAAYPIVSASSEGSGFRDVDGNWYIDIALGMGVHFFGHRHPRFVAALKRQIDEGYELGPQSDLTSRAASGVARLTGCERVSFCNTGSEAVMMALRIARAHTGRKKVVIFSGAYHGIYDGVLAHPGSEGGPLPLSPGTPDGMVEDLVILDYGTEKTMQRISELAASGSLAAVLVEPVQSRRPSLQPQTFLRKLRALTQECGVALIFDEMVNGFRICAGGAQAHFNIRADMALYGKIIAGGMPIGIIAGKAEYLDHVDGGPWQYGDASIPQTDMIVFGGTFCRHPLAMTSVCTAVEVMEEQPNLQASVNRLTEMLADSLNDWFQRESVPMRISYFGSQFRFDSFGRYSPLLQPVEIDLFFMLLLEKGIYVWERRTCCLSVAHSEKDIHSIIAAVKSSVQELRAGGFEFAGGGQDVFRSLTSVERRLLAEMERKRDQGAYHMPAAWMVEGAVDADRLEIAIGELIKRHDILRTSYRIVGGEYRARIEEEPVFSLERVDAAGRDQEAILRSFVRPFDLSRAPLLRFGLVRFSNGGQLLMLDALHLVLDGISMAGLSQDIQQAYESQALPPPAATYADYAKTMQAFVDSEDCRRQRENWQKVLSGAERLVLPLDYPLYSGKENSVADHFRVDLDAEFTGQLRIFSKLTGVSLFMTLAGAYGLLLKYLTGRKDVCIGTVSSGRPSARFDHTLGMFANTLVLRLPFVGGESVAGYLKQVRDVCIAAYANQDLPFEFLAESGYGELVQTMLTYENADERELRLGANKLRQITAEIPGSMFPCSLDIIETQGVLHLDFEFDTVLLERETVARWAGSFQQILKAFLSDPSAPISRLTVVDKKELDFIRSVSAGPARDIPEQSLASVFRARAVANPDVQAVEARDGSWNYRDLDAASDRIATALVSGRRKDKRGVAICSERSRWFPAAVLGVLKAGCWYLPLLPDTPSARAKAVLKDAGVDELLVSESLLETCGNWGGEVRSIESCADTSGMTPVDSIKSSDLAYVIYTSGSTGYPKGVMVEQRSVLNLVQWLQDVIYHPLGAPIREGMLAQFVFDVSVQHIFGALLNGHTLHIFPEHASADGISFRRMLSESAVDLIDLTPSQFMLLTEQGRKVDFGKVRHINFGAEALTREHISALYSKAGNRDVTVCNMYGPTETCVQSVFLIVTPDMMNDTRPIAIGHPISNTTIHVLDDDMQPVGIGVFGEIWIGGAGLARGYLGQEALTCEVFRDTKWGRLYRSGDRGCWRNDGCLAFLGRLDDQVKIMGHRIELGEIEETARRHPSVSEAAAVVVGEGREAVVVLYLAPMCDVSSVRMYLEANLPPYMIPRFLQAIEVFPHTVGGKTDKRQLPKYSVDSESERRSFVPPAPGREKVVADVFAGVLGKKPVGRQDSFFDLGGDSIKALQIVARLVEAGYSLTVADVFQSRTVAALAVVLGKKNDGLQRGPYTGSAMLSPMQRWFFEQHDAGRNHYNHSFFFKIVGVSSEVVREAAMLLWKEHDALRARFECVQTSMEQVIWPVVSGDKIFFELDLRNVPEPMRAMEADAGIRQATFSLEKGPLFQVGLYQLPGGAQRLLFLAHHLVVDGVTWRILLSDFESAVQALQTGHTPRLAPRSASFAEWGNAVAALVIAGRTRTTPEDWVSMMKGVKPVFPGQPGTRGVAEHVVISAKDISEQDLSCLPAAAYGGNASELLLAAFLQSLRQHTGRKRIGILLEGHGRELPSQKIDLSRTAGWFTSLWPVCFSSPAVAELLEQLVEVKEIARAAARNGFDYSVLRYSGVAKNHFEGFLEPDISFNYLGRFDQGDGILQLASETAGSDAASDLAMNTAFELDASFIQGELRLEVAFLPTRVQSSRVRSIISTTLDLVREYIDVCRRQERQIITASSCTCRPFLQSDFDRFLKDEGFSKTVIDDCYPLTSTQEGMLFHLQQKPRSGAYFEQLWFDMEGSLSVSSFTSAWQAIVQRHPALRTVFRSDRNGRPLQIVMHDGTPELTVHHWDQDSGETRQVWIERLLLEDRSRPFDLEHGSLLRCMLLKLGDNRWRFVQSYSHIIADGWCTGLILSELVTLYADPGSVSRLPTPVPYGRFIAAREELDDSAAQEFWRRHMEGAVRTGIATTRQGSERNMLSHSFTLATDLVNRIEEVANRSGVTLGALFQAAWSLLLSRHNRRENVVFGLVVSGRAIELSGVEEIVGLCIGTVPARANLREDQTLSGIALQLQESQWIMEKHPSTALAGLGFGDVVDHILVFENYPMDSTIIDRFAAAGLQVTAPGGYEQVEYNLSVEVNPGKSFDVTFHYNTAVYDEALFPELSRQLTGVFMQFVASPDQRLGAYLLDAQVVPAVSVAPPFVPVTVSMMDLADKHGEEEAFVWLGRSFTRAELALMAKQVAAGLIRIGLKRGDVVCAQMERSEKTLPVILGIWLAGGVYLPLDPTSSEERILSIMNEHQGAFLIADKEGWSVPVDQRKVMSVPTILKEKLQIPVSFPDVSPADAAYILYTSGSTGQPKGVVVEHASISNLAAWVRGEIYHNLYGKVSETWIPPLYFDASFHSLLGAITRGHTLLIPDEATRNDPESLLAYMAEHKSRVANTTPTYFSVMLDLLGEKPWPGEVLILGAEVIPSSLLARLYANQANLSVVVYNLYGPTEACVEVAWYRMTADDWERYNPIPIGYPVTGAVLDIRDERGLSAPAGVPGAIWISGVPVARGYFERPEENEAAFKLSHEGLRSYCTGDLGRRLPDGAIVFMGRTDRQIKLRGFRIEPGEIESRLMRCEGVTGAAVVSFASVGDQDESLGAFLVGHGHLNLEVVRSRLASVLPEYMVPGHFQQIKELPLNANHKLDEKALRGMIAFLPPAEAGSGNVPLVFANATEAILSELWADTLGTAPAFADQSFFQAGGNSVAAMRLTGRIRARFGSAYTIRSLYEAPRFREIAGRLAGKNAVILAGVTDISEGNDVSLTDEEKRLLNM